MLELTALTPNALGALMPRDGRPSPTRGKAVWRWLRDRDPTRPDPLPHPIPGVARAAVETLSQRVRWPDVTLEERRASADGTIKWRLRCGDAPVETVLIPSGDDVSRRRRATVCVSSQSGCTRWCDFCATARMRWSRQLSAGEIVAQVLLAQATTPALSNVVFMGMGEPLDNLEAVLEAIAVIDEGLEIAPRHCTVSTSGVLPKMIALWQRSRASLALSLHATTQELRDRLMPRVGRWPLESLIEWMRDASRSPEPGHKPRHFFVEYTLMAGVNDRDEDADRLVALLDGIRARVNLIPFNPAPRLPYARPAPERIEAFKARVIAGGRLCFLRQTRGDDALAACGQLAG